MRFGNLTYIEIKEKVKENYVLFIPTGCTEQQGPHLTVDFDTWFAEELLDEVTELANQNQGMKYLVAPTLPFGCTNTSIWYSI